MAPPPVMKTNTRRRLCFVVLLLLLVIVSTCAVGDDREDGSSFRRGHRHGGGRHGGGRYSPAPPAPAPPAPAPQQCNCCELCRPTPVGGFVPLPGGGDDGASASSDHHFSCVTSLSVMNTCTGFLTGRVQVAPGPQTECCRGFTEFLDSARAEGGGGDDELRRCLCPLIRSEVNALLPGMAVDPIRMLYLPTACNTKLPPRFSSLCISTTNNATSDMN